MNFVFEEVKIKIEMDSVEVFEKEDAKLNAALSKAISKKETHWLFNGSKINESLKYNHEVEKDLNRHNLVVRDCTLDDTGEYTIQVRNDSYTVKLNVKELPAKFFKPLSDQSPTEHNSVYFDVTLTKPLHSVKWYLNGQELNENSKFHPKQIDKLRFSLEIDDVLLNDSGDLKCVVFNQKGEVVTESECKLNVKGI